MVPALLFRSIPFSKTKIYVSTWVETLLVLSVFTKELASKRIFGIDFDFVAYSFSLFYFFYKIKDIFISSIIPWKLYAYLLFTSVISIIILDLNATGFLKQFIPIIVVFSVNFFIISKHNWQNLFRLYVKLAYISAIFGIIQVVISYAGINLLIKIPGRLDSISYEPSHYASILVPAIVFTFFHYKLYKKYFFVMIAALYLTYNLTGYLAFLLIISIAYINPVYFLISAPILYFLIFKIFVGFNDNFTMRILDTIAVFRGDVNVLSNTVDANGTTISLYSNLMVAQNNMKEFNLIGSGLGGHEQMYYRYYDQTIFRFNWFYGMNAASAHSLTIRVFSELGIIGFILYVIFLAKRVIILNSGIYRSISLACLSHFLCKTFKLGGIIDYGTPFFFAMLVINYIHYKKTQKVN